MKTALSLFLVGAALATKPAPAPKSPVAWLFGPKPAAGAFATYEGETRAGEMLQKTRATFLYLGPAKAGPAAGEWLEIQEEVLEMKMPGMPEGAGAGASMVTRVFLSREGKILRTVVQRPGRPAEERAIGPSTSVAVGALGPFENLRGKLATGTETVDVAGLGPTASTTYASSGPMGKAKIWKRASDGLCVKLVDDGPMGKTTYAFVRAGTDGRTKIQGPIGKPAADPELEQWKRMQEQKE
jgi:hypothetical protein